MWFGTASLVLSRCMLANLRSCWYPRPNIPTSLDPHVLMLRIVTEAVPVQVTIFFYTAIRGANEENRFFFQNSSVTPGTTLGLAPNGHSWQSYYSYLINLIGKTLSLFFIYLFIYFLYFLLFGPRSWVLCCCSDALFFFCAVSPPGVTFLLLKLLSLFCNFLYCAFVSRS